MNTKVYKTKTGGYYFEGLQTGKAQQRSAGDHFAEHGPFAVSLVETAQMIFGDSENIAAFSLEAGDDIDKYREDFAEMIEAFPEGSLIMVDLFGGTPCNQVMRYIQETGKALEVAAGMNLPMLINAVMSREELKGKEFSMDTVENGKKGIFRIDVEGFLNDDDDE